MKRNILKETAKMNGVSVNEVRRDISAAIDEGMKSDDPMAIAFWEQWGGKKPTVEQFLTALAKSTKDELASLK